MGYYAIGIGGTGAKCLESLIHLTAAGMMPDGDLHLLFVDPDTSNGSRKRIEETLAHYVACKDQFDLGQTGLLKTKIDPADPILWTPFKETNPSLNRFFHYESFRNSPAGNCSMYYIADRKKRAPSAGFSRGPPSRFSWYGQKQIGLGRMTWSLLVKKS